MNINKSNNSMSFESLFKEQYSRDYISEGCIIKVKILSFQKDYIIVDTSFKCEGLISIKEFQKRDGKYDIKEGDVIEALIEEREHEAGWMLLSKEKAEKIKIWNTIEDAYKNNKIISGTIIEKVKGGVQVDIGVKAFLPGSQIDLRPVKNLDALIDEKYDFYIIKFNKKRGNIVLSRRLVLEKKRTIQRITTLKQLKEGTILNGLVKNLTDYGAFIDLGGIDGLLHVTDISWGRIQQPSDFFKCGDIIKVKVLKYDTKSERVSLGIKQIQEDPWINMTKKLFIGSKINGKAVSVTDYGVFVELQPGIEGLIHISEMSWSKRIRHPSTIVKIGERINVVILDIDKPTKRISLGIKQIHPNPWIYLSKKYPVGTVIQGQIRNLTDFGVFIHIEDDIDGLAHISDLSWFYKFKHPSDFFTKGDVVSSVVLNVDIENRRFSLGIKQLTVDPWNDIPSKYSIGTNTSGIVKRITDYGVFVEIKTGLNGLLHMSELSKKDKISIKQNSKLNVKIIDIDPKMKHIGLALNQS